MKRYKENWGEHLFRIDLNCIREMVLDYEAEERRNVDVQGNIDETQQVQWYNPWNNTSGVHVLWIRVWQSRCAVALSLIHI